MYTKMLYTSLDEANQLWFVTLHKENPCFKKVYLTKTGQGFFTPFKFLENIHIQHNLEHF